MKKQYRLRRYRSRFPAIARLGETNLKVERIFNQSEESY